MSIDKRLVAFLNLVIFIRIANCELEIHERITEWNPGIPGGVPFISAPVKNVLNYGADNKGVSDCKNAVIAAINSVPDEGGVVYFPEGTYLLTGKIETGKSKVVFRGDGYNKTKILCNHEDLCFEVITYKRGEWQNLISGYDKGSFSVVVEDGSKFHAGEFAEVQQNNDSALMYTDPEWVTDWAQNAVGQLFEIVNIDKDTIYFQNRIHHGFRKDLLPVIRPQKFVTEVGFEKFYIERLKSGNSTFQFKNAAYCWIKEIESKNTYKAHVNNSTTLGCEYRDSYFHNSFSYGGGGCGYGVEFGFHATDGLCENNIFDSLRHSMMVHLGAAGCVFGYNYSINPVQGESKENLNDVWNPPDISLHGHYARMNLFEGNIVQEIGISDHWGPMGPGNTFLRNLIEGEGVFLNDHSDYQNLIGNTFYSWGDDGTSVGTLRHGEKIKDEFIWDSRLTYQIPESFYLDSVPSFYGNLSWPSTGSSIAVNVIPAQIRWNSGKVITNISEKKTKLTSNKNRSVIYNLNTGSGRIRLFSQKEAETVNLLDIGGRIINRWIVHDKRDSKYELFFDRDVCPGLYLLQIKHRHGIIHHRILIP